MKAFLISRLDSGPTFDGWEETKESICVYMIRPTARRLREDGLPEELATCDDVRHDRFTSFIVREIEIR